MNFRTTLIVYSLALATEIYAQAAHNLQLQYFSKPSLMPILIFYYFINTKNRATERYLILAALFFSWFGDIFLLLDKTYKSFFILGLIAFLTAHVFYIFYFLKMRRLNRVRGFQNPLIFAAVAVYALILFKFLAPHVGDLLYPVAVYALVISSMAASSLAAFDFREHRFGKLCVAGTFLFLVSDSILAVNRFAAPFALAPALVMLTYAAAQFLITEGSLRNLREID